MFNVRILFRVQKYREKSVEEPHFGSFFGAFFGKVIVNYRSYFNKS